MSVAMAEAAAQEVVEIELAEGATVADALAAADARQRWPQVDWAQATFGVWSRACAPGRVLRDGDRVEIHRPLAAEPMAQRRARAKR